jgi:hypothetical protein
MPPRIYIALSPNGVERVTIGSQGPKSRNEAMELYRRIMASILDLDRVARNVVDPKATGETWVPRSAFL